MHICNINDCMDGFPPRLILLLRRAWCFLTCSPKLSILPPTPSASLPPRRGPTRTSSSRAWGPKRPQREHCSADERRNSELAYLNGVISACGRAGTAYAEAVAAHPRLPVLLRS